MIPLVIVAGLTVTAGRAFAQEVKPDGAIGMYQRMLQRSPRDGRAWFRLDDAYVQKARERGDVAYFDRAEQRCARRSPSSPAARTPPDISQPVLRQNCV